MRQMKRWWKRRLLLAPLILLALLGGFLEIADRPNSWLKWWLYERGATHHLQVATVALKAGPNPRANLAKMVQFITDIKKAHPQVELIFFGEVILGSYLAASPNYHREIAQTIPGPATETIAKLAKENAVFISFGMPETTEGKPYNAQVTIDNQGQIIDVQHKKDLRSDTFTPGDRSISLIDIKGITTGIVICADLRLRETLDHARAGHADLILLSNADYTDDFDRQYSGMRFMAKKFGAWIVIANRIGAEQGTNWDGHLEVYSPFGDVAASGKGKEEALIHTLSFNKNRSRSQELLLAVFNTLSSGHLVLKNLKTASKYLLSSA